MKSKTVKMVSAAAVLAVLCGAYAGVKSYVSSQEEKEAEEADQSVSVVEMNADDIVSVAFRSEDDGEVTLEKEDDSWVKKGETEFPLSQDSVSSAVSGIAALTADQKLEETADLSEYDLEEPENEITVLTDDGEETTVQVGMMNSSSQYYVKKAGDDENVYLVSSSSLDPFMGSVYDLAEAETFPSVTSSTITQVKVDKENGYELKQNSETLGWDISDGKDTEKADTTQAGTVTSAIGSLTYDEFVDYNCTDEAEYGFDDPYAVITADYTVEEETEADTDDTEVSEEEDTSTEESAENESGNEDAIEDTTEEETTSEDTADADSSEDSEETEIVTKDEELIIYVGDETDGSRYVKVNDSNQVYTISEDSLADILDKTIADFYDLTVSYLTVNNLETMDIEAEDGSHEVQVVREITEDEDGEEITTSSYKLDGKEIEETAFTTFYNKVINMTGQQRLTEEYDPEGDPAYTFTLTDIDGEEILVKYYEYDASFYAAVVEDRVYLVNKMDVRDMDEAYQEMITAEKAETKESSEDEEAETEENTDDSGTGSEEDPSENEEGNTEELSDNAIEETDTEASE